MHKCLICHLHVRASNDADAAVASPGALGRHMAPVQTPRDQRHRHADSLALQCKSVARVQFYVGRFRWVRHVNGDWKTLTTTVL